ncbi:restriction endonuclease subunit S [Tenacibaculum finnmarkense]|uniref:restriction endonuclease subunit S n=1 Tax=Tenacibaculum finnmarkense TaxID=2781243 RepID=UPI001EFB072B|nr:restriction endonuclease subunit S [Tenacibaculum finnmarkense]MCG8804932.1 restriction endonuclease subunit S [Tenacibaculum finnmarkense]MCG8856234.1 restriction endonuclease subunit S [Tenacibaculum finnmarkense]WCC48039.1 restriction endonuclease subunit S [Tenacibaculum finnmarkense]
MNNLLKTIADYSKSRISLDEIDIHNYVSTDNLLQNKLGKVDAEKMPTQSSNNVTRFDKGDILIANIRPYLKKIWLAKYTGGSSSDVLTFKVNKEYNSTFVYYSLFRDDFFEHMMNGSKGTKMPRGDKNQILDFPIPDFEIGYQKSIAKVLSDLDSKIAINNKINAELEAMAKTLYDYWFVQFDFPDKNGKPYKSSEGKMIFNEDLKREIPVGWEVEELGSCIKIFDSLRIPMSRSEREKVKGDIPYYGATSIMGYVKDFIFNDEYILLAEDGSVMNEKGMPIVQFIWGKTWVNNHAHVIQANNKLHNEFIYQLVKMIPVVLIKTGSIQMKINQTNLNKYKVIAPPFKLVNEFSNQAIKIRKQLINNKKQNQKLSELRDWLLPMLMNGQVSVGE